jgi:hypothetical protein
VLKVEDGAFDMSEPLRNQINSWWRTVSSEETLNTYQNTLQVTWNILRETAGLIWLFLCLGLVFFDWFRDTAIGSGRQLKTWIDALPEPKVEHAWSEVVSQSKSVSQVGTSRLLEQARGQLGITAAPRPATQPAMSPTPSAPSTPVISQAVPAKPAPTPTSPPADSPSAETQEAVAPNPEANAAD